MQNELDIDNTAALLNNLQRSFHGSNDEQRDLQNVIYLVQELGLPLGYTYEWNNIKKGPWSPKLSDTLKNLSIKIENGFNIEEHSINKIYLPTLSKFNNLIQRKPATLSETYWNDLLSTLLFLEKESGYDEKDAKNIIIDKKLHLFDAFNRAKEILTSYGFLPNWQQKIQQR